MEKLMQGGFVSDIVKSYETLIATGVGSKEASNLCIALAIEDVALQLADFDHQISQGLQHGLK